MEHRKKRVSVSIAGGGCVCVHLLLCVFAYVRANVRQSVRKRVRVEGKIERQGNDQEEGRREIGREGEFVKESPIDTLENGRKYSIPALSFPIRKPVSRTTQSRQHFSRLYALSSQSRM